MAPSASNRFVHLELHTGDLARARTFYAEMCGWRSEQVDYPNGPYLALEMGGFGGGLVECKTKHPLWLPYVEVDDIGEAMRRARQLGASALLEPREGPAGWRGVVTTTAGGEIALWQPKEHGNRT